MTGLRFYLFVLGLLTCIGFAPARAAEKAQGSLFDPARHMRISEVRPGMTGYGLSVFHGDKIERFGVEVLSILHNFNPQYDVILVRCHGANLEHTGSIAGMSGSPIFLRDDHGKDRMVGAFAYGWPMMKDPIGGVQPIEYMLKIHPNLPSTPSSTSAASTTQAINKAAADTAAYADGPMRWNLSDAVLLPGMSEAPPGYPFASIDSYKVNPRLGGEDAGVTQLRPLATPLMTTGLPQKLIDQLNPIFHAYGMETVQAGSVAATNATTKKNIKLEPGSVLCVPLVTGDMDMTAVGTCTEVIGKRIFGFGHPFNNEGSVDLPIGAGVINGIIANLMTSFKLGSMTEPVGSLFADDTVGVAGTLGKLAPTIPIHIRVHYTDGSADRDYHFQAAWHSRLTPLLATTAITTAITGIHDLPEYQTLDYDFTYEFQNGQKLHLANSLVNTSMPEMFFDFGTPLIVAASNPFEQISVKRIDGTVNITPKAREATILWVNTPRLKFRPGETLKAFVTYRPFRSADRIMPVEFDLPRDLPEGDYQFTISGWEQFLSDERTAKPFRFSAESAADVFDVLRELSQFRREAIYMRLVRQPDGVAIGRTAMPNLPSSRREVLLGAGRSNVTPFVNSTTKVIPVTDLMDGSAQFQVTIDKNAHVETGVGKPPRHESTPQGPAPKPAATPTQKQEPKPDVPIAPGNEPSP